MRNGTHSTSSSRFAGRALLGAALLVVWLAAQGGCDWFEDPVAVNFPPTVTITDCPGAGDVLAGDDVVIRWSGADADGAVVSYEWTYDDTAGGSTAADTLLIESVIEGDHVFSVSAVDDEGDTGTPATCSFTAGAGGGLVERNILVEFLTDFACVNCPNGEEALENLMDEYGRDRLCVVAYHSLPPVGTTETADRQVWYQEALGFSQPIGHPCAIFDGLRLIIGADSAPSAEADYDFEIGLRQPVGSPLTMELTGDLSARGSLTVSVRVEDALPQGDYVLRTLVLEDGVSFAHHAFPFVVRDILGDEPFTLSAVGDSVEVVHDVELDPAWNVANLDAVAFVQDDDTLEVLQSVRLASADGQ